MLIIGLTGGIGMGKSTAAQHLRAKGIDVFDADACVHALYRQAPIVAAIEEAFPGTTRGGMVDRGALAVALQGEGRHFVRLEAIVHPAVRAAQAAFIRQAHDRCDARVVLEVPLLYETGAHALVDAVIVVSADAQTQRARVLKRPGMSIDKLETIRGRQLPDSDRRAAADFVVDTSGSVSDTQAQIDQALDALSRRTPSAYARHWGVSHATRDRS